MDEYTPASLVQIVGAGYDPSQGTYVVDSSGNVIPQTATVTVTGTPTQPISPLLIVLAVIGVTLYYAGTRHRR